MHVALVHDRAPRHGGGELRRTLKLTEPSAGSWPTGWLAFKTGLSTPISKGLFLVA
jgi:hypothetical protein